MLLIINEQHSLFLEQEEILNKKGSFKKIEVPATGWTLEEQRQVVEELMKLLDNKHDAIVFASPVPYLLKVMSLLSAEAKFVTLVFHNDNREKVELPNGKIINKVAKTGWQLV